MPGSMIIYSHREGNSRGKEGRAMKIYGMNKKACAGLWVVYIVTNKSKYFVGAYRDKAKAEQIAEKYHGETVYID